MKAVNWFLCRLAKPEREVYAPGHDNLGES
jgi:hypothetical protein